MQVRFKKKSEIIDVAITGIGGLVSVGTMLYGVASLGLSETWPELVLNVFYIACLVMMILIAPPLSIYWIKLVCHTLSVLLLLMLTYFYARKEWKTYSKRNLWMICIIDMVIAALYHYDIVHEPVSEYTEYLLTEIWIRPTITYGLVACFVSETKENPELT